MNERALFLIEKLWDETCSEEELHEIAGYMRANPEFANDVRTELNFNGLISSVEYSDAYYETLAEAVTGSQSKISPELVDEIMLSISESPSEQKLNFGQSSPRPRVTPLKRYKKKRSFLPLSIAACFILTGVLYFMMTHESNEPTALAKITMWSENSLVELNGEKAGFGEIIYNGDTIQVGADSRTQVTLLNESTTFTLSPESSASFNESEGAKTVILEDGMLYCKVDKQKRPLKVLTDEAEVSVLGTEFSLATNELKTEITMSEGLVNLRSLQNNEEVKVKAGESAEAGVSGIHKYLTFTGSYDFEQGNLEGLTVTGDFPALLQSRDRFLVPKLYNGKLNKQGKYFISTIDNGKITKNYRPQDYYLGTITSEPFVLLKPEAKVLLAGGTNESLYLSIHLANGTEIHRVTNQKRSEIFSEKTITLKDYLGEKIYWKVVDQSQDEWGWITVDDIRFNQ